MRDGDKNDARPEATGRASHQQIETASLVTPTVQQQARSGESPSRINPDTKAVQWTVVGLVACLGVTSFIVSFWALHDVAAWAGLAPSIQWAVPVFIDGAILAYALSVLVHRARGESTIPSWISLAVFTAMSVAANAAHAVSMPQATWWQTTIGAAVAALAPLGVFAATEQMARLVVLRPQDRHHTPAQDAGPNLPVPVAAITDVPGGITDGRHPEPTGNDAAKAPAPAATPHVTPAPAPDGEPAREVAGDAADAAPTVNDSAAEDSEAAPPAAVSTGSRGESASFEDEFAAWVAGELSRGRPVTGRSAGDFLGVAERTGRNKIKELRAERPELFEGDAA